MLRYDKKLLQLKDKLHEIVPNSHILDNRIGYDDLKLLCNSNLIESTRIISNSQTFELDTLYDKDFPIALWYWLTQSQLTLYIGMSYMEDSNTWSFTYFCRDTNKSIFEPSWYKKDIYFGLSFNSLEALKLAQHHRDYIEKFNLDADKLVESKMAWLYDNFELIKKEKGIKVKNRDELNELFYMW